MRHSPHEKARRLLIAVRMRAEGRRYREIGAALGVSPQRVLAMLKRAPAAATAALPPIGERLERRPRQLRPLPGNVHFADDPSSRCPERGSVPPRPLIHSPSPATAGW